MVCYCLLHKGFAFAPQEVLNPKPDPALGPLFLDPQPSFPSIHAQPPRLTTSSTTSQCCTSASGWGKRSTGKSYLRGQGFFLSPRAPRLSPRVLVSCSVHWSRTRGSRIHSHHPRGQQSTTHPWGYLCPRLPSGPPRMSVQNQSQNI